jgi:NAD(P)H-hydrate epimerase
MKQENDAENELFQQLTGLFRNTQKAHHQAYIETDGADDEWPMWYAGQMHEELAKLLNARFTKSELVYLIVQADKEQKLYAPGSDWATYYAHFFLDRYA